MKKLCLIVGVVVSVIALADDFVDDVYYSNTTALNEQLNRADITPYYNKKNMTELLFEADTVPASVTPDTINLTTPQ